MRKHCLAEEDKQKSLELMQQAMDIATALYGKSSVLAAQAKLKLGLAKSLHPSLSVEGLTLLQEVELEFHAIANEVDGKEDHDILFSLLFEF